jgi:tetratricopeptide (TPR) repeat protein
VTGIRKEFGLLLFALFLPWKSACQISSNSVTVSGVVFSEGRNERIEHTRVRLCDGGGNLLEEATTAQNGEFGFRGLSRGRYILTFEAMGYVSTQMQVDLSYTSDKGINVYLQPIKTETHLAPAGPTVSAHELSMPEVARKLVSSGRRKVYVDKNLEGGMADFQQALGIAPDYYEAYRDIAMTYSAMGEADKALESLRQSIEVSHDTYGDGYIGLGTLLVEKGEMTDGERAIRRGVGLNPNSWEGHYELGKIELGRDQLDESLKSATLAKTLAPSTPIIYRLLANIHLRRKDYADLLVDLDDYIKLDPKSPAGERAVQMRAEVAREVAKQGEGTGAHGKPQ